MLDTTARPPRLAPSDLVREGSASRGPGLMELAGRVLAVSPRAASVCDALSSLEVALDGSFSLHVGELVVLAGGMADGGFRATHVVARQAPTPGAPAPETERFTARGVGASLRARAAILREVRSFFEAEGFLEVETPLVVPSPGMDLHLDAFEVPGLGHLITSPEYQMKRLLAGGVPRCFQVCKCFRRDEVGRRHNPEFTMLEWYRAFADVEAVMADTEALVRRAARAAGAWPSLSVAGVSIDLEAPFERVPVATAFARWAGVSEDDALALAVTDEDRFFRLLVDAVEPALARATRPVFLVDYPAPFASLARLSARDARVAERFELYVAGVELCNGFGELTDPGEQRRRFVRDQETRRLAGKAVYPIDERFLSALDEGMPPAGGNALGLDRLVAVCLGTDDIREVTAFPAGLV